MHTNKTKRQVHSSIEDTSSLEKTRKRENNPDIIKESQLIPNTTNTYQKQVYIQGFINKIRNS